jgi:hypothetical protein
MAELIYLHLLLPKDIGGPAKRAVIDGALDLLPLRIEIPADLDRLLDDGLVRAGTAYMTQRDRQIAFLVRFVQTWKSMSPELQDAALHDPWLFRAVVDEVPINSAYSQRNVLLNLAFPETFAAVVSRRHKRQIVDAFAEELPEPTGDVDRDLAEIVKVLRERSGAAVRFYAPPLLDRWRGTIDSEATTGPQGWLVRGRKVHGHNLVLLWLVEEFCSIASTRGESRNLESRAGQAAAPGASGSFGLAAGRSGWRARSVPQPYARRRRRRDTRLEGRLRRPGNGTRDLDLGQGEHRKPTPVGRLGQSPRTDRTGPTVDHCPQQTRWTAHRERPRAGHR